MEILIGDAVNKKYAKTIQRFRRQHFGELEGEPNPDQGFYYKEKYFGSGNVLHLLLTPYKGLSGPKKKTSRAAKKSLNIKFLHFSFLGQLYLARIRIRIPNPNPLTHFNRIQIRSDPEHCTLLTHTVSLSIFFTTLQLHFQSFIHLGKKFTLDVH